MRGSEKVNALRFGLVVLGALAFGYLTLQLGFRPFLERAQQNLNKTADLIADDVDGSDKIFRDVESPNDQLFSNPSNEES